MTRIRMTVLAILVLGGSVGASFATSAVASARPNHGCSRAKTAGHYGFVGDGNILASNPFGIPAGPFTTAGIADFRPNGTWNAVQTLSFNGDVIRDAPASGTWDVSADCLFSNVEGDGSSGDSGRGAVVENGRKIVFMDAGRGVAATFTAEKTSGDR